MYTWSNVLILWIIAIAFMSWYYHAERTCDIHSVEEIRDVIHANFPKFPANLHHIVTLSILAWLLLKGFKHQNILRVTAFRLAVFYIIRTFMISMTEFPCYEESFDNSSKSPLSKMITLGGTRDYMPSGHAGIVFVTLLTLLQSGLVSKQAALVVGMIQMWTPVLTRCHYSVDTITSLFISIVICQNVGKVET